MQDSEKRAWLALHRTPGLSTQALRRLLQYCPQPEQVGQLSPLQLDALELTPAARNALLARPDRAQLKRIDRDLAELDRWSIALLPQISPDYPPLLLETADPPPLLYVRGDLRTLHLPQIAMVGSRRCSRQGGENAVSFGKQLAQAGLAVTSGCALGIDAQSHRGALAAAGGRSIGVLGTGVDVVYPKRNQSLFMELIERGALVSEFPLGTQPHRALFPQRNRLISGLSLGVLVVEAALQSGSLITARYALEQNREVFAIPGSIHNPGSEGCHYLIRQGAQLVTRADEVLEQLRHWAPGRQGSLFVREAVNASAHLPDDLPPREGKLLAMIGFDPTAIDTLVTRSGWPVAELQGLLTVLEIRGLIEQTAGCYHRLVAS